MIEEKYIERVSIDESILENLRAILKAKKINMKQLSQMDESLNYGYLRQVFQGNHSVVSYQLIKTICNCLDIDVAMLYSGLVTYK